MNSRPPAVQQVSGVVLQGPALLDARRYLRLGVELARRRDGCDPSPSALGLLQVLDAAADSYMAALMSASGHADTSGRADRSESELGSGERSERVATREAADILKISERHVRRLRRDLGGVRTGTALLFDRETVEVYAAERAAATREESA